MTNINMNGSNINRRKAPLYAGIVAAAACTLMAPSVLFGSCGVDLGTQITTQLNRPSYHGGVLTQTVTLKNLGSTAKGTIYFEINDLPPGVSVQNFTWTAACDPGAFFFRVYLGPNNEWASGATMTLQLHFVGAKQAFPYTHHVIRGTNLPNPHAVPGDYDGDRLADFAFYNPVTSVFTIQQSSNNLTTSTFYGTPNLPYRFTVGDFDGDLKDDISLYDPATALWSWRNSSNGVSNTVQIGSPNDIPVPGDYDGDGYTDIAVYHQQTSTFIIWRSSDHLLINVQLGQNGDIPVPADYDGDGTTDVAVYRGGITAFMGINSSTNQPFSLSAAALAGIPIAADFDGDGKADMAVYNVFSGVFTIAESSQNVLYQHYVGIGKPVVADFSGNGQVDVGIYTPSTGGWVVDSQVMNPALHQVAVFKLGTPNQDVPMMAVPAGLNFPNLLPW